MAATDRAWLTAWLTSLELEVDVPLPEDVSPNVGALLDFAWKCSQENREKLQLCKEAAGIAVRLGWKPKLPVFTVEWEQTVKDATVDGFVDLNMRLMAEKAAEWDTTFLGAEYLADHGNPSDDLSQFARLVRWRFRAAPLQDREMLYIVVPYRPSDSVGPLMLAYISVKGPRYPVAAGFSRGTQAFVQKNHTAIEPAANPLLLLQCSTFFYMCVHMHPRSALLARNLVPSFDLCEMGTDGGTGSGALRIQHCMTTDIGGGVAYWVWNHIFKSAVLAQNEVEAAHVRDALQAPPSDGAAEGAAAGAAARPGKRRVVIAGFGDSGLTTAVHMASRDDVEIIGISPTACHYSAQELGGRLAQPSLWKRVYLLPFEVYRGLDRVKVVQGMVTKLESERQCVVVRTPDGSEHEERYDALLIATGCTNGFWRKPPEFRSLGDIEATLLEEQETLAAASTIAVVGGGPSGVSAAYNLGRRYPRKGVHCFVSGEHVLPGYHPSTVARIEAKLADCGVVLHLHHRAIVPAKSAVLGAGPIAWSTGQPEFAAEAVIWAVGGVQPNSTFLPVEMLTPEGFVAVDDFLRVKGGNECVFAVGDIAATDAWRASARNDGWALVGANIAAYLSGQPAQMRRYQPPKHRWGSILGPWDGRGYEVYFQNGLLFWLPLKVWNHFWPLVQRFLFAGMRNTVDWTDRIVE